jgi:membrane protein required for colicin V production
LNWLDLLIALFVTLPTFTGFRKGFVRKILGIGGIIAGFILAVKFYSNLSDIIITFFRGSKAFINVISFLLIIMIVYFIAVWISGFISDLNFGVILMDKLLGTITGFFQGVLFSSIILYNLAIVNIPSEQTRKSSYLYPYLINIAPAIFDRIIEAFPGLHDIYKQYRDI